jgi:hypothetical protein
VLSNFKNVPYGTIQKISHGSISTDEQHDNHEGNSCHDSQQAYDAI